VPEYQKQNNRQQCLVLTKWLVFLLLERWCLEPPILLVTWVGWQLLRDKLQLTWSLEGVRLPQQSINIIITHDD